MIIQIVSPGSFFIFFEIKISMEFLKKISLSHIIVVMIILMVIIINFKNKYWKKENKIIHDDIVLYYAYLPALFIYNDLKFEKKETHEKCLIWLSRAKNGNYVLKYTSGLSMLYLPFFLVAHVYTNIFGIEATGYTAPYKIALILSNIFYLLIGLFLLRKILLKYFSDLITSIVLIIIVFGTNILHYIINDPPMPHVYNFSLFIAFIWLIPLWLKKPSFKLSLFLGIIYGLIILVRPSNIIIIIFLFLWDVTSWKDIKNRFIFFMTNYKHVLVLITLLIIIILPQLLYWKYVTGNYIYYSYTDEGFFFKNPQITEGLIGYRKGWLIYTPVMWLALTGIPLMFRKIKALFTSTVLFIILNTYIILSWWCWWYGGSFGHRAFIDSYGILAIPMAITLSYCYKRTIFIKILTSLIICFFITLNIFQNNQFNRGIIHWEAMTKEAYWKIFGKAERPPDLDRYLDILDLDEAIKGNYVTVSRFGNMKTSKIALKASNGKYVTVDPLNDNLLYANKTNIGDMEIFTMGTLNNKVAFLSYNDLFVSADANIYEALIANRFIKYGWEEFTITDLGDNKVAFQSHKGLYVTIDITDGKLVANMDTISESAILKIVNDP